MADGCFIELFYGGADGGKNRADHICFEVDDIHETADQLKKKGVPLEVEISQGRALNHQFWLLDPDGNWLEFMEMNPESHHMKS